jgi:hypothetical protein
MSEVVKKKFTNIQINMGIKKELERASYELSTYFDERVPMTRILQTMVDHCMDDAKAIIKKEMNFDGK